MKTLLYLLFLLPCFAIGQTNQHLPQKQCVQAPRYMSLNIDYNTDDHVLTILTKDKLEQATIMLMNASKELLYKEDALEIKNHYLLYISENYPEGTYYVQVEEEGRGIWIEQFEKE